VEIVHDPAEPDTSSRSVEANPVMSSLKRRLNWIVEPETTDFTVLSDDLKTVTVGFVLSVMVHVSSAVPTLPAASVAYT
jgi:hypothetical protein